LPLSGPVAASGQASLLGIRLAAEDLSSPSLVPRRHVSISVRDSKFDPAEGARQAKDLIGEGKASGLFSSFSYVTQGVTTVAKTDRALLLYDSCNCGFAEQNPYAFQLYFDPRKECAAAAEGFKAAGATVGAYLGLDVPYGRYCYEAMEGVLGAGNVVIVKENPEAALDYSSLLSSFEHRGVGFIVSVPASASFAKLFAADRKLAKPIPIVCYAGACGSEKRAAEAASEPFSFVQPFNLHVTPSFMERFRIAAGGSIADPNEAVQAAVAHDAMLYAAEAARACSSNDTACMVAFLTRVKDAGAKGAVVSEGFGSDRILDYASEQPTRR
jgi:ABC-type branched-subunit amino acid transport system substrate-binding protein